MTLLEDFEDRVKMEGVDGSDLLTVLALIGVAKAAKEFAECDSLDVQMQLKSALAALDKELEG